MSEHYTSGPEATADAPENRDNVWRSEIQARVAGYRNRRGRHLEGNFSMRFPFPPAETEQCALEQPACADENNSVDDDFSAAAAPIEAAPEELPPFDPTPERERFTNQQAEAPVFPDAEPAGPISTAEPLPSVPSPSSATVARPRPRRKVIAFPRQASTAPEEYQRLADPVIADSPRILDVPEELEAFPATPLFDGLQLPSLQPTAASPADHVDLPVPAVALSRRFYAGLIDCALVSVAAAVFGAICYEMLPKLQLSKPIVLAMGAAVLVLWSAYEYIFTLYHGATPGMRALRLKFRTFQGGQLGWRHRRSRVVALYFSTASLMMGLLWALVDVDALCWHDRLSRSFVTQRK